MDLLAWILLGVANVLTFYLQQLPAFIWRISTSKFSCCLEISNNTPAFDYVLAWFEKNADLSKIRNLSLTRVDYFYNTPTTLDDLPLLPTSNFPGVHKKSRSKKPVAVIQIAPGSYFIRYKKIPIWIRRTRMRLEQAYAQTQPAEILHITAFCANPNILREMVDEILQDAYRSNENLVEVRSCTHGRWVLSAVYGPRPRESVVLPGSTLDNIIVDCEQFVESEDWYTGLSIPYRRGYLLHGEPGTGKTITVHAVATALRTDIWYINLGDPALSDNTLSSLILEVPKGSIILFEDIDRVEVTNSPESLEEQDKKHLFPRGITLAGLLNALDGLSSQEGRLVFMTTNHKEKLAPALIRPGRIDYQQEYTFATYGQAYNIFSRFYPQAETILVERFAKSIEGARMTMADLQQILLVNRRNPQSAVEDVEKRPS